MSKKSKKAHGTILAKLTGQALKGWKQYGITDICKGKKQFRSLKKCVSRRVTTNEYIKVISR